MSSPKPNKPTNAPTDTRSRILDATWKLMEDKQTQGTRMSDIAKATGISRQALYLHFASRTELLVATTRYVDEVKGLEKRLEPWNSAQTGEEMIERFVELLASYYPEIYGLGKALLSVIDTDEAAAEAWNDRMYSIRNGCQRMVNTLHSEGNLSSELTKKDATNIFWTLLSVRNWEQFTVECGWSKKQYIKHVTRLVKQALIN